VDVGLGIGGGVGLPDSACDLPCCGDVGDAMVTNAELAALVAADETGGRDAGDVEPWDMEAYLATLYVANVESASGFLREGMESYARAIANAVKLLRLYYDAYLRRSIVLPYPLAFTPDNAWNMG